MQPEIQDDKLTIVASRWIENLQNADEILNDLILSSEEKFISIGNKLYSFSSESKKISEIAGNAAVLLNGKDISGVIFELTNRLCKIDRYLTFSMKELEKDIVILEQIESYFGKIHESLNEFGKIVKLLNILSISIRIESTRLSSDQHKFDSLADDVTELSGFARTKMQEIFKNIQLADDYIKQLLSQIKYLKENQYIDTKKKMDLIFASIKNVSDRNEGTSEVTKNISDRLSNNSESIKEIVTSLQFHDIVRQNIEHVKEAISDLITELHDSENDFTNDASVEIFKHTGSICRLQEALLRQGENDIMSAIEVVIDQLNHLAENVTVISNETRKITEAVNADSQVLMDETQSGASYVVTSLKATVQSNKNIIDIIKNTIETVKKMGGFVEDIDQIGSEIELIAVNGIIHAAHMGKEGAPLSVLADSAQQLSVRARKEIGQISDQLREVNSSAENLRLGISSETDENVVKDSVDKMANDLEKFVENLHETGEKMKNSVLTVELSTIPYAMEITETVSNITVHETFREGMQKAEDVLNRIIIETEKDFGFSSSEKTMQMINQMKVRYTMSQERGVHDEYIQTHHKADAEKHAPISEEGDGVDDNVELF